MKKAVFLVIHFVPHQEVTIRTLLNSYNYKILSFTFQEPSKTNISNPNLDTRDANSYTVESLVEQILLFQPEIMVVSGWLRRQYVQAAKTIRQKLDIPVIAFSDTQWNNTIRQRINTWISSLHLKKAYSHLWISGIYQYEYAKKLGFKNSEILHNFLSCDVEMFTHLPIRDKTKDKIKKIVFIGRLVKEKGLDLLIQAWKELNLEDCELRIIGSGACKENIDDQNKIIFTDFLDQKSIANELHNAYAFILPSRFEPWGIVIHEAVSAGIPILASYKCGAAPYFLIDKHNGFLVTLEVNNIKTNIKKVLNLNPTEYLNMCKNSRSLSNRITPQMVVANLLAVSNNQ